MRASTVDGTMMLNSMTAYARVSEAADRGTLTWELRSVNHRYLEVSSRLPEEFRALETMVRDRLKTRFARGKFDVGLRYQPDPSEQAATLTLNRELAAVLIERLAELSTLNQRSGEVDLSRLLAWPGLVTEQRRDPSELFESALQAMDHACDELADARAREGQSILEMLTVRLDGIEQQAARVRAALPGVRAALRQRFSERIAALGMELDPGRLEQEIALQLTKLDVDEELDRLDAHVTEVRRVLAAGEPAGRRLDFLMQELNREANTLGSKAVTAETAGVSVELKVLIEQMREQVQNVE
ncbi:MAG: YicC/YloC family endoribonuclease [Wenzhouxiangellaceae bacterium]|nr:YicC/YloC family endoribonuclease [Wenzhouxiangellaceae bacterium]